MQVVNLSQNLMLRIFPKFLSGNSITLITYPGMKSMNNRPKIKWMRKKFNLEMTNESIETIITTKMTNKLIP